MEDTTDSSVTDAAAAASGDNDSNVEPEVDRDELTARTRAASEDAAIKAELATLKRATGHIPVLQKSIAAIEAAVKDFNTERTRTSALADRLEALIEDLPTELLSERSRARIRPERGDNNADLLAKFEELSERLDRRNDEPEERDIDPASAAALAGWNEATLAVQRYAESNGFDFNSIPDSEWEKAAKANLDDPSAAAVEVMRYVARQKATGSKTERVAERKDAGKGGADSSRSTGASKTALTLDSMRTMSVKELRENYTPEERMAALRAG